MHSVYFYIFKSMERSETEILGILGTLVHKAFIT